MTRGFFSLLGVVIKMDLNMGEAQAGSGLAMKEIFGGRRLSTLNSRLGFGMGEGAVEAGVLTDCSSRGTPGDLVSVRGVTDEAGVSPRKVAEGIVSKEVLTNGPVSGETTGVRRLGVVIGEGAVVVAAAACLRMVRLEPPVSSSSYPTVA